MMHVTIIIVMHAQPPLSWPGGSLNDYCGVYIAISQFGMDLCLNFCTVLIFTLHKMEYSCYDCLVGSISIVNLLVFN